MEYYYVYGYYNIQAELNFLLQYKAEVEFSLDPMFQYFVIVFANKEDAVFFKLRFTGIIEKFTAISDEEFDEWRKTERSNTGVPPGKLHTLREVFLQWYASLSLRKTS